MFFFLHKIYLQDILGNCRIKTWYSNRKIYLLLVWYFAFVANVLHYYRRLQPQQWLCWSGSEDTCYCHHSLSMHFVFHSSCPERCHVMPGLSATFSNGRDPLRGSKRRKSHFYGHYGPQIPIFGTSFLANFFSLQNMGMWGVQSDAMWYPVFLQPFQTQGNPLRGSKRPKNQFYGHFGPKIPIFWLFWAAEWVPWVCHVMFGPYATFSNPRDPISGS